ncbi:hypothetical protein T03_7177 [Trichinella britovi]|uniref:Uncharacterized protein n=1 Tax=Trichinella britovi TaxID=45882 RepID=A0A0V1DFV3_TRIBR|nr:hypothetical protein T03_7177 [Trichinella britovi]
MSKGTLKSKEFLTSSFEQFLQNMRTITIFSNYTLFTLISLRENIKSIIKHTLQSQFIYQSASCRNVPSAVKLGTRAITIIFGNQP